MTNVKIAQLCYLYEPALGGVETVVKNISKNLVKLGHDVHVYTSDFRSLACRERIVPKEEVRDGIWIHRRRGFVTPRVRLSVYIQNFIFPTLFFDLIKQHYDIIHVHSIPSNHYDIAWLISKMKGNPLFVTGHYSPNDLDAISNNKIKWLYWNSWMKFSLKRITKLLAIIESEKQRFASYWNIPIEKIEVLPNGINTNDFDAIGEGDVEYFSKRYGLEGKNVILQVGRIARIKGMDILLNASIPLFKKWQNLTVLIIGPIQEDSYFADLKRVIEKGQIQDRVKIIFGLPHNELICAYKLANIVVSPSRGEVFGITLIEGMYSKKIVIGSNAGGFPEVITDGVNGFLFESENPDDLRIKIDYVLENYPDLDSIRENAYKMVRTKNDWAMISKRLESLYKDALVIKK